MVAGLILPELPVGNMYFAAWSHSVIYNAVNLANDLKMGEYLKIPPRVMFLTQIYGTILGGFVNYVVMKSIITNQRELLMDGDGINAWSGASIQAYNTTATSWALANYLYKIGRTYVIVPMGLPVGFLIVALHRLIVQVSLFSVTLSPRNTDSHSSIPRSKHWSSRRSTCPSSSSTWA